MWRSRLSEHGAELETAHTECCSCELTYKTFLPFWQKLNSVCTEKNRQDPTQLIIFHHRLALLGPSYTPSKVWQKKNSQSTKKLWHTRTPNLLGSLVHENMKVSHNADGHIPSPPCSMPLGKKRGQDTCHRGVGLRRWRALPQLRDSPHTFPTLLWSFPGGFSGQVSLFKPSYSNLYRNSPLFLNVTLFSHVHPLTCDIKHTGFVHVRIITICLHPSVL